MKLTYFSSFMDDAFRKNLESALRFGNPLLVQVRKPIFKIDNMWKYHLVGCGELRSYSQSCP